MNAGSISAGDTAWVLISSALVLLMVPGLALFYAGLVRPRAHGGRLSGSEDRKSVV